MPDVQIDEHTKLVELLEVIRKHEAGGLDHVFKLRSDGRWEISTLAEGAVVEAGDL